MPPLSKHTMHKKQCLTLAIVFNLSLFTPILKAQEEQAAAPEKIKSRIVFTNGNKLTGEPHDLDTEGNLQFTSENLGKRATFPLEKLRSIELDTWKDFQQPETLARLELQPRFGETTGDILLGSLHELTPDSFKLNTWYGGIITLKRSMVKSLQIITTAPGNYHGPSNIKEWSLSGQTSLSNFRNGALQLTGKAGVGRDVGLTEKSHISFETSWKTSMRFNVLLYSNDVTTMDPDACYNINFNNNYVSLRTLGTHANKLFVAREQSTRIQAPSKQRAKFDLFFDRKAGMVTLYINGNRACMLTSQTPNPIDLGTGISFVTQEGYPIEISNIRITPWNGTPLTNKNITLTPSTPEEHQEITETPPHRIILKNGDEVPGTIGKVEDERMIIETDYTPIRIPIKRIKSLSLDHTGEQPKMYQQDIRAWFHNGGRLTLKLARFENGKINGFSQALGDVSIDLRAFNQIDFHIYDIEYQKQRIGER